VGNIKIQDPSQNPATVPSVPVRDERTIRNEREASFSVQMKKMEMTNYQERIKILVDKIEDQGKKIGKKADIRDLTVYKQLISEFLGEAVANSHKFNKKNYLDKRGRHRVYAVIKKINDELVELTNEVIKSESDHLKILQKLDDIRGLIMDLFL
jgi:uncharacterized protein YaaR (DUF327 family)